MNIAACIAKAALLEPHSVCGVRLRPFCIGHWIYLTRFNVSFLNKDAERHTMGDLILGIVVCSETWEGFQSGLLAGDLSSLIRWWTDRLSGGWKGRLRRRIRKLRGFIALPEEITGINLINECARFQTYLDYHGAGWQAAYEWACPVSIENVATKGQATPARAPYPMHLLDGLISEIGLSFNEAINLSLPLARWLWAVHVERKGLASIVDMEEHLKDQEKANEFARKVFENVKGS